MQVHDDLLLLVHGRDMFSQPEMADERNYYKPKAGRHDDHATPQTRNWSAGMAVFDISEPAEPRQIGFMPVEGTGLHRIWYVGGRWAYASAMMEGFSDYILVTIDMADPTKPAIVGRYWLPGMNLAAGEVANWPLPTGRYGLHHAVVQDDVAYCAWGMPVSWWSTSRTGAIRSSSFTKLGAAVWRRHAQLPAATRPQSSCSTRRCSTRSRTASSRSGCSTTR